MEIATITGTGTSATIHYTATDHLTGSNLTTNSSDIKEELLDYLPFGTIRIDEKSGTYSDQRKFAGHEYDVDTSLSYMDARYYDGATGRFLSVDPAFLELGFDLTDPQSLNSYAYSRNNPLRYADPNGESFRDYVNNVTGYVVGFGQGIYSAASNTVNAITHPVQTVQNTANYISSSAKSGQEISSSLSSNPSQTLGEIKTGYSMSFNEFSAQSPYEQGRQIGNTVGQIEVGVAVSYGAGKTISIAKSANTTRSASNFFKGTSYSPKVLRQMKIGDYHSFSEIVRNYAGDGKVTKIIGGDGKIYSRLDIPGGYNGAKGSFSFIKDGNGNIMHRKFEPSKK
ncbi:MAG: RHS repeat-associated core domain-containing protein [Spirochaetia bacterium]|nr:RHS repeat-associated core domain-containing protein [Spirochaetia bacterium]